MGNNNLFSLKILSQCSETCSHFPILEKKTAVIINIAHVLKDAEKINILY